MSTRLGVFSNPSITRPIFSYSTIFLFLRLSFSCVSIFILIALTITEYVYKLTVVVDRTTVFRTQFPVLSRYQHHYSCVRYTYLRLTPTLFHTTTNPNHPLISFAALQHLPTPYRTAYIGVSRGISLVDICSVSVVIGHD
jgi:hypothetical protein